MHLSKYGKICVICDNRVSFVKIFIDEKYLLKVTSTVKTKK